MPKIRIEQNKVYVTPDKPKFTEDELQSHIRNRRSGRIFKSGRDYRRKPKHPKNPPCDF